MRMTFDIQLKSALSGRPNYIYFISGYKWCYTEEADRRVWKTADESLLPCGVQKRIRFCSFFWGKVSFETFFILLLSRSLEFIFPFLKYWKVKNKQHCREAHLKLYCIYPSREKLPASGSTSKFCRSWVTSLLPPPWDPEENRNATRRLGLAATIDLSTSTLTRLVTAPCLSL